MGADEHSDSSHPIGALERRLDALVGNEDGPKSFLLVLRGAHRGRLYALEEPEYLVGRAKAAGIRLDENGVSHRHARIAASGGRYTVEDLRSTNGTLLNGEPLEGCIELRCGDELQFGDSVLTYITTADEVDRTVALSNVVGQMLRSGPNLHAITVPGAPLSTWQPDALAHGEGDSLQAKLIRIRTLWGYIKRYWRLATALSTLGAVAGIGLVYLRPPLAEAALVIQLTPKPTSNPVERNERESYEFFRSAERNFSSPQLIRITLESMGEPDPSPEQINAVKEALSFKSVAQSTYHGTYKHPSSRQAVTFLEHHAKHYVNTEINKALKVVQAEVDFLTARVHEQEEALQHTEEALKRFKEKHLTGLPEYVSESLSTRAELQMQRIAAAAALARAEENRRLASQRLERESPLIEQKVSESQPYQAALVDVRRRISEAKAKGFGDEHPEVRKLRSEERELDSRAQSVVSSPVTNIDRQANPAYTALHDQLGDWGAAARAAQKELAAIDGQLAQMDQAIGNMPEVEAQYAQLSRSYESTTQLHRRLFEKLRASELQLELEREAAKARYDLIEPPHSLGAPLRKALVTRTGLGAIAGLLLAGLVAGLIEIKRLFRTLDDPGPAGGRPPRLPNAKELPELPAP